MISGVTVLDVVRLRKIEVGGCQFHHGYYRFRRFWVEVRGTGDGGLGNDPAVLGTALRAAIFADVMNTAANTDVCRPLGL